MKIFQRKNLYAPLVELVDTLDLGSNTFGVGVRVPQGVPTIFLVETGYGSAW